MMGYCLESRTVTVTLDTSEVFAVLHALQAAYPDDFRRKLPRPAYSAWLTIAGEADELAEAEAEAAREADDDADLRRAMAGGRR